MIRTALKISNKTEIGALWEDTWSRHTGITVTSGQTYLMIGLSSKCQLLLKNTDALLLIRMRKKCYR